MECSQIESWVKRKTNPVPWLKVTTIHQMYKIVFVLWEQPLTIELEMKIFQHFKPQFVHFLSDPCHFLVPQALLRVSHKLKLKFYSSFWHLDMSYESFSFTEILHLWNEILLLLNHDINIVREILHSNFITFFFGQNSNLVRFKIKYV